VLKAFLIKEHLPGLLTFTPNYAILCQDMTGIPFRPTTLLWSYDRTSRLRLGRLDFE